MHFLIKLRSLTPEDQARENIDQQLKDCGWIIQDMSDMNIMAGLGVAVREFQLTTGEADYGLYIDGKVAGVIEAKKRAPRLPELKPKPTSTPKAFLMESRTTDCRFPSPPDCVTAKSKSSPAACRSNRFTSTSLSRKLCCDFGKLSARSHRTKSTPAQASTANTSSISSRWSVTRSTPSRLCDRKLTGLM